MIKVGYTLLMATGYKNLKFFGILVEKCYCKLFAAKHFVMWVVLDLSPATWINLTAVSAHRITGLHPKIHNAHYVLCLNRNDTNNVPTN